MTLLSELLEQVSKSDLDEQVKKICDQIMLEESRNFINLEDTPIGPNIFLAIEYFDKNKISFLCLERESKETYITTIWSKNKKTDVLKRKKVWEVNESKAEKIIKFYATKLKFVRGE